MKRFTVFLFIFSFISFGIFAKSGAIDLDKVIDFQKKEVTLGEIFNTLDDNSIPIIYSPDKITLDQQIRLSGSKLALKDVLSLIKDQANIKIKSNNNHIVFSQGEFRKYTISGTIKDQDNGETLIGAQVYVASLRDGCISNYYGFYSLQLPEGKYTIRYSYLGYENQLCEIDLTSDLKKDINLLPSSEVLQEVVIHGEDTDRIHQVGLNGEKISVNRIKTIPTMLGEPDVLKTLQLLPGVQTAHEGTNNLSVRGGSFDQNLILLDEAPLYNPSHTLGIYSAINSDAVNNMEFYKGEMPARYGGRLSSVIDIRMKEGNNKRFSASGSLGLLSSKLSVESPLFDKKTSFILCGRYSYAGYVADLASDLGEAVGFKDLYENFQKGNNVQFFDLNFKINRKLNDKNRIYLSAYTGKDQFYFKSFSDKMNLNWANTTSTLRWNSIVSSKIFHNLSLIYSNYNYAYKLLDDSRKFLWTAGLSEYKVKSDWDFYLNSDNHIRYGADLSKHNFDPGKVEPRGENSNTKSLKLKNRSGLQSALYVSNEQKIGARWKAYYGLRWSFFQGEVKGLKTINFNYPEPRLSLGYDISKNISLKTSYVRTVQYLHMIANSSLGLPTDIWLPSAADLVPQKADQLSLGAYSSFDKGGYEASVEVFGKKFIDIVDFRDNADLFLNENLSQELLKGKGRAYGVEFLLKKTKGNTLFWLSYTWSKAEKKIDGINDNNWYPASFDRRNSIKLTLTQKLSKAWAASANFVYSTGSPITVPVGIYQYQNASFIQYSKRNAYRLPDYHRLDISFNYNSPNNKNRKWKSEWNFGLYNVYGRKNVFSLYVKQDAYDLTQQQAYQIYLFTFMPSVTYRFKF
ncbi:MAG: carboxypeptidase-like regulatory domain-containing protein [Bacteroidales bacterium]